MYLTLAEQEFWKDVYVAALPKIIQNPWTSTDEGGTKRLNNARGISEIAAELANEAVLRLQEATNETENTDSPIEEDCEDEYEETLTWAGYKI